MWKAEDYINNSERWVHDFSVEEIEELSVVADKFLADAIPLTGISQVGLQRVYPIGHKLSSIEQFPSSQVIHSVESDPP